MWSVIGRTDTKLVEIVIQFCHCETQIKIEITRNIKIILPNWLIALVAISAVCVSLTIFDPIDVLIYGGAVGLLAAVGLIDRYFGGKCRCCGKPWAMRVVSVTGGRGWFDGKWQTCRCNNCGFTIKRRIFHGGA